MQIIWRCESCGLVNSSSDEFLRHVWDAHAGQILRHNPGLYTLLWELATKQAALRRQVFGVTTPCA